MSLYRITTDTLEPVSRTTFAAESLLERKDLQRLLKQNIAVLGEDLMVVAEEFGNWEDSNRRIDLFCLSKDASLVVVEIKRTEDGGHMELQAIRYAAMVSAMTLDQVIQAYARERGCDLEEARSEILRFLGLDAEEAGTLSGEVRVILVSANFSTEVTAAVLWLNKQGLKIRCIRLRPYRTDDSVFVDAAQIIPLPEAAELEPKWREQEQEKQRAARSSNPMLESFWKSLIERAVTKTDLVVGHKGSRSSSLYIPTEVPGVRFALRLVENQAARVLLLLDLKTDRDRKLQMVEDLMSRHQEVESAFGGSLEWIWQSSKNERRFRHCIARIGYPPESDWLEWQDQMIDALIRLEAVLRPSIEKLKS
jgi:hypothetical protein